MPEKRCWWVGKDSNWWHKDMSANSSFMATNCPEAILATSLAVIGGRADYSTMAVPGLIVLAIGPVAELTEAVTRAGKVAAWH